MSLVLIIFYNKKQEKNSLSLRVRSRHKPKTHDYYYQCHDCIGASSSYSASNPNISLSYALNLFLITYLTPSRPPNLLNDIYWFWKEPTDMGTCSSNTRTKYNPFIRFRRNIVIYYVLQISKKKVRKWRYWPVFEWLLKIIAWL